MPAPVTAGPWPDEEDLRKWLGPDAMTASVDAELLPEVMAEASATIYESLNPAALPDETEVGPALACPLAVRRAIVLTAARLLFRRGAPHGLVSFGDTAMRLRSVDADVEQLLYPYTVDPRA